MATSSQQQDLDRVDSMWCDMIHQNPWEWDYVSLATALVVTPPGPRLRVQDIHRGHRRCCWLTREKGKTGNEVLTLVAQDRVQLRSSP